MNIEPVKLRLKKVGWLKYPSILMLILSIYWLSQSGSGHAVPAQKNSVAPINNALPTQNLIVNGTVQAPEDVAIVSKIDGKVVAVPVTVGQLVHAGQALVVLESKESRASVLHAKAAVNQAAARLEKIKHLNHAGSEQSLSKAKATLDQAKKQYARVRELSEKGYVSQGQLNDALRNLAIAQSQLATSQFQAKASRGKGSDYAIAELALNKARTQERLANEKLENLSIKADVAGLVTSKIVDVGHTVLAGATLMFISPSGNTQLTVKINQVSLPLLKLGQKATIQAEGYLDQRFDAVLSYISPETAAVNGSVEIKFDVPSPPDFLRQNMAVSVDIDLAKNISASRDPCCILAVAGRIN